MKIAYLMHGLGFGGAASSLLLMIKSLSDYKHNIYLFASHITFTDALNDLMVYSRSFEKISIDRIHNDLAGGQTPLRKFNRIINRKYPRLLDRLNQNQIDIIHINSSTFPHLLPLIKNSTRCKIVTHVREIIPKYGNGEVMKYMINQIKEYSDAIICISDNEARPFKNHPNLHVIANPFDISVVNNVEPRLREEYGIDKETILVGIAGKFSKSKGQKDFLLAADYLVKNFELDQKIKFVLMGFYSFNPHWKVVLKKLLGRYDYGYDIKRTISKCNLTDLTLLLPYRYDFFNYLIDIDIIVRSATSADPWGRDIIESFAFAKPVVATGTSDFFIKNGINGYLVPPGKPEIMASRIHNLIINTNDRLSFGKAGRELIFKKCNLESYGKKINSIYQSFAT